MGLIQALEGFTDNFTSVKKLEQMGPGQTLSQAIKNQPTEPEPWQAITARETMLGTVAKGIAPGSGVPLPPSYNPFTGKFDISVSQLNPQGAPNFTSPKDSDYKLPPPGQLDQRGGCSMNTVTHVFSCADTFQRN
jgi:hypothetical protein